MQFTKPSISVSPIEVRIENRGEYIEVIQCRTHPLDEAIRAELKKDWRIEQLRGDGYRIEGGTPEDRRLLRTQLFAAYLGSTETGNDRLISLIVQAIIKGDCRRRNDDEPSFPPNWDPSKSNDGFATSCIETAKAIIALL